MSQETRQRSNRDHIVDILLKQAGQIAALMKTNVDLQQLVEGLKEPRKQIKIADQLANARPGGARALPPTIRRKTARAVEVIEKLVRDIQATPVTTSERTLSKRIREVA